jgi:hypothetical protein
MQARFALAALALAALAGTTPAAAQDYNAIWAAAPGDIWAVGSTIVHGGSGSWIMITPREGNEFRAVDGSGPRDVWIVGDRGDMVHWTGDRFQRMRSPVRGNLVGVKVCSPTEAWAITEAEDNEHPAVMLHWDGQAWTPQRLPVAFRPTGIAGGCPDLTIAGTTFFDPRPDQRRDVGVVMRLQNGSWVASGWDGQRVTDETLGGTGWTGAWAINGCTMLRGGVDNAVLMMSCRGAPWQRLNPRGEYRNALLTFGGPVILRENGFSTWSMGSWHDVTPGPDGEMATQGARDIQKAMGGTGQTDAARVAVIQGRIDSLQRAIGNKDPNPQQMQLLMQLSQQMMQASGMGSAMQNNAQIQAAMAQQQRDTEHNQQVMSQSQRNALFRFGNHPVATPAVGGGFYVAANSYITRFTGDQPRVVFTALCTMAAGAQSAECAPDAGAPRAAPLAAQTLPPLGPEPPETGAPAAPSPKNATPRLPRVRLPGRP